MIVCPSLHPYRHGMSGLLLPASAARPTSFPDLPLSATQSPPWITGSGQYHVFKDDLLFVVALRIARSTSLQPAAARYRQLDLVHFFPVVCGILRIRPILALTLRGVEHIRTAPEFAGINTEECQLPNERIAIILKARAAKGLRSAALDFLICARLECRLTGEYPAGTASAPRFVEQGAARPYCGMRCRHRNKSRTGNRSFAQDLDDLVFRDLFAGEIFFHNGLVVIRHRFDQLLHGSRPPISFMSSEFRRPRTFTRRIIVRINDRLHFHKVNATPENMSSAPIGS